MMKYMRKIASIVLRATLAGVSMFVLGIVISQQFTVADRVDVTQTFWQTLTVKADEVEGFESLQSMAAESDCVLRAHIVGSGISRQIQGDAEEDVVTFFGAKLDVSDVIRGENCSDVGFVEFLLPVSAERAEETAQTLSQQLPQEELILALRNKGGDESGLYRLVNSRGLWIQSGEGVHTPLATDEHESGPARFAGEVSWIRSLDDLAELLKG